MIKIIIFLSMLQTIFANNITLTNNVQCVNINLPIKQFIKNSFKYSYNDEGTLNININITNTNISDDRNMAYGLNQVFSVNKYDGVNFPYMEYQVFTYHYYKFTSFKIIIKKDDMDNQQTMYKIFICGDTSNTPMTVEYQYGYWFDPNYKISDSFTGAIMIPSMIVGFMCVLIGIPMYMQKVLGNKQHLCYGFCLCFSEIFCRREAMYD